MILPAALMIAAAAGQPAAQPPAAGVSVEAEASEAGQAFAALSRLAGVWRPADDPQSPLRIRFSLTAGGTVLVETWEVRGRSHSLTLYHRDGAGLLATHYCPQGNQPRLAFAGRNASGLHFAFRDATDLAPGESHQHDLWFELSDPDRPLRSETYAGPNGPGAQERLRLVRDEG